MNFQCIIFGKTSDAMLIEKEIKNKVLLDLINRTKIESILDPVTDDRTIKVSSIPFDQFLPYISLFEPGFGNIGLMLCPELPCMEAYALLKYRSFNIKSPSLFQFRHKSGILTYLKPDVTPNVTRIDPSAFEYIASDPIRLVRVTDKHGNMYSDYTFSPKTITDNFQATGEMRSDLFSWIVGRMVMMKSVDQRN